MAISTTHSDLLITTENLAGELASWAVQQSPYDVPDGLEQAIRDFRAAWPHSDQFEPFKMEQWLSYEDLRSALEKAFVSIPSIEKWNHRKNGREGIGFASRFDRPAPDDDFIDLGALANNVAREVWKDACDFHDFNADFDRRHGTKMASGEHACRICGCTEMNACIDIETDEACAWAEPDLCTSCKKDHD